MTAHPFDLNCCYTVEEFAALPEDNSMRYELTDGRMVGNPRPGMRHSVSQYAATGIPHMWLVDLDRPVTATTYRLVNGQYEELQRAVGRLWVSEPCPLRIDLDALLPAVFE